MSSLELKSIRNSDGCTRDRDDMEDVKLSEDCSKEITKVIEYRLFSDKLAKAVVEKLDANPDLLFCGFEINSEFECMFKTVHLNYPSELELLRNGLDDECYDQYLKKRVRNRFSFINRLEADDGYDKLKMFVPVNKGFVTPQVTAKYVKFDSYVTGCFFKKTRFVIVEPSV